MIANPALRTFVGLIGSELQIAQVLVRRKVNGFELRHEVDGAAAADGLRDISVADVRGVAQFTATGEFRPLKSAPTLVSGWRLVVSNAEELGEALNRIYPGAIADWYAAQGVNPPVTGYREFTGRQSGMYRITTMLNDLQVGGVIQKCCSRDHCLKRRLWTVEGWAPDAPGEKSLIPCLEPCAVLLESARKAVRLEQEAGRLLGLADGAKTD